MQVSANYYLGSKLIKNSTGFVYQDRLGSIGKYYPFGVERPSATQNGKEKFTGYLRDAETGLDYADQRFHMPGLGRFLTTDPLSSSAQLNDPGTWNRYAYVGGDPINRTDPTGQDWCDGYGTCYDDYGNSYSDPSFGYAGYGYGYSGYGYASYGYGGYGSSGYGYDYGYSDASYGYSYDSSVWQPMVAPVITWQPGAADPCTAMQTVVGARRSWAESLRGCSISGFRELDQPMDG